MGFEHGDGEYLGRDRTPAFDRGNAVRFLPTVCKGLQQGVSAPMRTSHASGDRDARGTIRMASSATVTTDRLADDRGEGR